MKNENNRSLVAKKTEEKQDLLLAQPNHIKLFEGRQIRSTWNEADEQWYFVVEDVVAVLTDSTDPKQYVKRLKLRDPELAKGWVQIVPTLIVQTEGGPQRMRVANAKGLFRIIQSIPSHKAEPFKQWLAQVGYERLQEIENPELAQERMKALFEAKGYPKDWIDKRLRGIAIRQNLTDAWKENGITEQRDYAILTAEISRATFGITPSQHKEIKGLTKKGQNLRDHMTDLELIFTMLGERITTEVSQQEKPKGMNANIQVARRGGKVAGVARKAAEEELGHSIVSEQNFIDKNPNNLLEGYIPNAIDEITNP